MRMKRHAFPSVNSFSMTLSKSLRSVNDAAMEATRIIIGTNIVNHLLSLYLFFLVNKKGEARLLAPRPTVSVIKAVGRYRTQLPHPHLSPRRRGTARGWNPHGWSQRRLRTRGEDAATQQSSR